MKRFFFVVVAFTKAEKSQHFSPLHFIIIIIIKAIRKLSTKRDFFFEGLNTQNKNQNNHEPIISSH